MGSGSKKATELYHIKKNYLGSLALADITIARYPGTREAESARLMHGMYHESQKNDREAVHVYEELANDRGVSKPGRIEAHKKLWSLYSNLGRTGEAIRSLNVVADASVNNEDDFVYAHYYLGHLYFISGPSKYPDASKELNLVIYRNPNRGYAKYARNLLAQISAKSTDTLLP